MVQTRRRINDAILFYILFPNERHIDAIAPQNAEDLLLATQLGASRQEYDSDKANKLYNHYRNGK
jgi:hypothetical protein